MNFNPSNVIDGLAAVACAYAGLTALSFNRERQRLERAIAFYNDTRSELELRASYNECENEHQLCGGCGKSLSPGEISQCPGVSCPHYQESGFADVDTELAQRKLNVGYIGNLHTTKVFGIK